MVATASTTGNICGKPLGLATASASALVGLEARAIHVEVCTTRGPAFFQMVGLAEAAVREARVRVASSLALLGVLIDEYAVTINLAPADLRKSGAALDVAIAVAVLGAVDKLAPESLAGVMLLGELSLDGRLRPIRGVLPQLEGARLRGVRTAIVPAGNAREAGLVGGIEVRVADRLESVCAHLKGERLLPLAPKTPYAPQASARPFGDLADVRGQNLPRRALEIAAAGGHNLLFVGPPGGGKTLLARLMPSILPPLSFEEAIEATAIHSVAGLVPPEVGMVRDRPFRSPHHSVSEAGLIGGGDIPRPGEVSLAHHGVLFLDELAEFRRGALEALRQPLEDGRVCIARARARAWFPARPLMLGATNPCPCGYWGHPTRDCRCSEARRKSYLARLSGPLLDRLDIHVGVKPVPVEDLVGGAGGESSACVLERVVAARRVQRERHERGLTSAPLNALLSASEVERSCDLDAETQASLASTLERLGLSARAYVRVLRVARTCADLERSERVRGVHLSEAIQGRLLDHEPPK